MSFEESVIWGLIIIILVIFEGSYKLIKKRDEEIRNLREEIKNNVE